MATYASNRFKYELLNGGVTGASDVFKIILMQSGFTFNRVSHNTYADVSASELSTASGYTIGGLTLANVAISQNDTSNKGQMTWDNASWTAAGGNVTARGAIIFDDTHASDIVVGYIDFGSDQTTLDGGVFTIADIEVDTTD
jgi:hypothetical protein